MEQNVSHGGNKDNNNKAIIGKQSDLELVYFLFVVQTIIREPLL